MNTNEKIQELINSNKVFLFMKGTPENPQCGFSARAISLLRANGVKSIGYFDVLSDDSIRNGIKVFSAWPTIPQLYVKNEFIGGSDIMLEMHESGELESLLD